MGCPKTQSLPGLRTKQSFLLHWNNVLIKERLRESNYKRVDDSVFKWFLSKRNQDIPTDGIFIKEKAL